MTPEMYTIVGVGIALAGLILAGNRRSDLRLGHLETSVEARFERLEASVGELRERMAHLEGLLEGLREAITRNRAA